MTGSWKKVFCFGIVLAVMICSVVMLEGCKESGETNGVTETEVERDTGLDGAGEEYEDAAQRSGERLEEAGEETGEAVEDTGEAVEDTGERTGERMEEAVE